MMSSFRPRCEVLIVGGGVAGVSVAYHLGKLGITDVMLCERKQLTCGTTWHAAGLVTQLRSMHVYETLQEAGAALGLRHAGFFAINALRMEKGYRHWGHDIGQDDTPLEAGLGFAVAWDKPGGFKGREALIAKRETGPVRRRLVQVRLDEADAPMLHHNEPIWRGGRIVGEITSGAWGHTVGASLGMGYVTCPEGVTAEWLAAEPLQVEVAWARYRATAQLAPWLDPRSERVKA